MRQIKILKLQYETRIPNGQLCKKHFFSKPLLYREKLKIKKLSLFSKKWYFFVLHFYRWKRGFVKKWFPTKLSGFLSSFRIWKFYSISTHGFRDKNKILKKMFLALEQPDWNEWIFSKIPVHIESMGNQNI